MTRITRALTESAIVLAVGFAAIGLLLFAFAQNVHAQTEVSTNTSLESTSHLLVADVGVSVVSGSYASAQAAHGAEEQSATEPTVVYEEPHHPDTANVTVVAEGDRDVHTEKSEKKATWQLWLVAFLSLFGGSDAA